MRLFRKGGEETGCGGVRFNLTRCTDTHAVTRSIYPSWGANLMTADGFWQKETQFCFLKGVTSGWTPHTHVYVWAQLVSKGYRERRHGVTGGWGDEERKWEWRWSKHIILKEYKIVFKIMLQLGHGSAVGYLTWYLTTDSRSEGLEMWPRKEPSVHQALSSIPSTADNNKNYAEWRELDITEWTHITLYHLNERSRRGHTSP